MKHFVQLSGSVDTAALSLALHLHPELWNAHAGRKDYAHSPHKDTSDIWLRYNDLSNLGADYKAWTQQHDSVWLPAAEQIPQLRPIVFGLMARCEAVRLGGILITKIPAGASVKPHADRGWHPSYYNVKLYVPLQSNPLCVNRVEDECVVMKAGEVWYFDNTREHGVVNGGDADRITLIICLRVDQPVLKRLTEREAQIEHFFAEGLYAKKVALPKGCRAVQHAHKSDHLSILAAGRVRVTVEGVSKEHAGPACITICKGERHEVIALEDSTWFCVHATGETDVGIIDSVLIAGDDYAL